MTRIERVLTLGAALIGCAATVWMVPEVRCHLGVDGGTACAPGGGMMPSLPQPQSRVAMHFVPAQDPRITRIRDVYRSIEAREAHSRFAEVPFGWRGADSANVAVYRGPSEVDKIRLRVYAGGERTSLLFYYSGGRMVFVHQVARPAASAAGRREQRFYFDQGSLIRWLGPGNEPVSEQSPEYRRNSEHLDRLGTHLLSIAREG